MVRVTSSSSLFATAPIVSPSHRRGAPLHRRPWQAVADTLLSSPLKVSEPDWTHLLDNAATSPRLLARHLTTQLPALDPALPQSTAVLWLTNHCELPLRLNRRATDTVWTIDRDTLDRSLAHSPDRIVIGSHLSSALQVPGFEHPNPTRQYEALLSHIKTVAPQANIVAASVQELELWSVVAGCSMTYGLDLLADYGVTALTGFHEQPLVASWRQVHHPRLIAMEDWLTVARYATRRGLEMTMGLPVSVQTPAVVWQAHWAVVIENTRNNSLAFNTVCPWGATQDDTPHPTRSAPNGQWIAAALPAIALEQAVITPWPQGMSLPDYLLHESALQNDRAQQLDETPWAHAPLPEWLAYAAVNANCWRGLEAVWHQHF